MARILAVDDERAILDALARVLGRDGYEVVKASDPTAVPGMDLSRFDLVLWREHGLSGVQQTCIFPADNP